MYSIVLNTLNGVEERNIPYSLGETLYYCDRRRGKWRVLECTLRGIWATNIVGVTLRCCYQDISVDEDCFKYIFQTEEDAVQFCLKENQKRSVKVVRTG